MQAIVTKYLAPTNTRGARVKVTAARGSITLPWDYALDVADNHYVAARTVLLRWEWPGRWAGGCLPDGGYAFVHVEGNGPPSVDPL